MLEQVDGHITYNGSHFQDFVAEQTASFVPQSDLHLPEVTVRENLDFGARVQGPGVRRGAHSCPCIRHRSDTSHTCHRQAAAAMGTNVRKQDAWLRRPEALSATTTLGCRSIIWIPTLAVGHEVCTGSTQC